MHCHSQSQCLPTNTLIYCGNARTGGTEAEGVLPTSTLTYCSTAGWQCCYHGNQRDCLCCLCVPWHSRTDSSDTLSDRCGSGGRAALLLAEALGESKLQAAVSTAVLLGNSPALLQVCCPAAPWLGKKWWGGSGCGGIYPGSY